MEILPIFGEKAASLIATDLRGTFELIFRQSRDNGIYPGYIYFSEILLAGDSVPFPFGLFQYVDIIGAHTGVRIGASNIAN